MALKTLVKINKANNLSDARYCAGMGVEFMGFCLDPTNEQSVMPEKFNEITGWISGVKLVGEFYESSPLIIKELLDSYKLDYIQVADADILEYLAQLDIPLILQVNMSKINEIADLEALLKHHKDEVAYFLLIEEEAETDKTLDKLLPEIDKFAQVYPILLGYGIDADNVLSILENTSIAGIALEGGHEIKPGYKDFDALADVLEKIEIDDLV